MLISIEEIKLHLRVDTDPDSELDAELEYMYEAAVDYCENYIDRPLTDSERPTLNAGLRACVLLKIGDLYAMRENTLVNGKPENTQQLEKMLHFHRVGLGV